MLSRIFLFFLLFFLQISQVYAIEQCLAIFPNVAQEFGPKLSLPRFDYSEEYIGDIEGANLALVEGQYKDISVDDHGVVFFTSLGGNYSITKLEVDEHATAIFVGGDYFIDTLILGEKSNLSVTGSDTVRIYANSISIDEKVHINDANGSLILISYDDISANEKIHFTGVMYALGEIDIGEKSHITGSITGGEVDIDNPATSTYQEVSITGSDFNGMCDDGVIPPPVFDYCLNTFVDGATSVGNGKIKFEDTPTLINEIDVILQTKKLEKKNGATLTCSGSFGIGDCTKSGTGTSALDLGDFYESNDKLTVLPVNSPKTIGDDGKHNFGVINVSSGGHLTFAENDSGQYFIEEMNVLEAGGAVTIYFSPGDYYIGELETYSDTTFEIIGGGAVRIFLRDHSDIEGNTRGNIGGAPENFLLYGYHDLHIKGTTEFFGLIYAQHNAELKDTVKLTGAISAVNEVKLKGSSEITYTCEALPTGMLLAKYRFEQTDFNTQIDDTSGNDNHGEVLPYGNSVSDGKYCRGFESDGWNSDVQISDGFRSNLDIDKDVGSKGTISFWFNSTIGWEQGQERILFDATADLGLGGDNKFFSLEIIDGGELRLAINDSLENVLIIEEPPLLQSRLAKTWYYVTATWDLTANNYSLYVDSSVVASQSQNSSGALIDLGLLTFGDNASTYVTAGNSVVPSPVSSRGDFDEVRIYNRVLTQVEIQADMNDDNGCVTELIVHYQMDKLAWNGTVGEVIDQTTNFNAQAKNDATTENSTPALSGNPGTCGYGTFDGNNQYIALPDSFENLQDSFTITAWIKPSNLDQGSRIFADDENNTQGYAFSLGDPGSGKLRFYSRGVSPISVDTSSSVIPTDTWTFVTAVHNSTARTREIYVNGVAQTVTGGGLSNTYSGIWGTDTGIASIGGETDSGEVNNRFTGSIDEVKVYRGALTATQINVIYNETHPCDTFIDHYQIDTRDQQGITCQADEIIIKACADASCSNTYPDAVDVKLLINNVEHKTVTVSGVNGTTTTYPHTTVGNAALSLDQTYKCTNTLATTPCNVNFKDSGFIISDIPMQISGKSSGEGFNSTTLSLRAVEKNTTTGVCDNVFPDDTDVAVNLSYTCAGGDCKDLLSLSNNGNSYNLSDTASAKDLYFGNNSTANFTLKYPHAAKFILNAQKDVEVTDSDNNTIIKDFSASSNAFVERPFAFKLDFSSDTNSANAFAQDGSSNPDASKSAFKKAGATFKLTATTVQWQNGQDNSPIDGVPDDFSAIDNNPTAEHFSDGPLTIIDTLLLPKVSEGGVEGTLATELSNSFVNSIITNEYNYSEVGIIKLSVNLFDGDYLGAGDILGEVTNVGRFTPAYFTQAVESHGSLNAYHYGTCNPITKDWVYAGQTRERSGSAVGAISYTDYLAPIIHISAYNLGKVITQNYTATDFMKLPASGITIPTPVEDNATARLFPTVVDEKVFISSSMSAGDEPLASATKGIVSYAFNILDHFIYEHNKHSKLPPFPASIPFLVTEVEDTDLVRLYDGSDTNITVTEKVITQGVEVRFGRWLLENSYGPETSPFPVTMFAQHFDGTSFTNNANENCLIPVIGSKVITGSIGDAGLNLWDYRIVDLDVSDNLLPSHTAATVENKSFTAGLYQWLLFSAPGKNNQGSLNVEYQVPPWLQYDWNNDTNFTNNPSTKLTFGIFRGNDRIIYQREIAK